MLSIITPVLNGAKYIESNILSIQKLTIPHEHIIVDGGSTDSTLEIVAHYSHLKLIHQTDKKGMYRAIHMGILDSKGDYVTWINSDDILIPDGYNAMYKKVKKDNLGLIYSNGIHHFIEKYNYKIVTFLPFGRYFLKNGIFPFVQPSSIFSKEAYFKVGGFDYETFKIIGDRDLFQKMAYDKSIKFGTTNDFTTVFLRYDESLLYRNLDRVKTEHAFTLKTNVSLFNRTLYHLFRNSHNLFWKIIKLNDFTR